MSETTVPTPEIPIPGRRTVAQILEAILAGQLDIADVKVSEKVQIDEIDKSGDTPKLTRTRIYLDGEQVEVIQYP